jgi:hypothetical protein
VKNFPYIDIKNRNNMETLRKIKELVEKMSVDTQKVFEKGNRSASIRARKYAQEIKLLIAQYRKEILDEIKKHD